MLTKQKIFARIFLTFLDIYEDNWLRYQEEFEKHVTESCKLFGVDEMEFYSWLSHVIFKFIREYCEDE